MKFLRKILGERSGITKDYDYYVMQKRNGGIYGNWETIEELYDFLDSATGVATYSDGTDATLRCLGVNRFGGREIKKNLWQHVSREDTDEEIEDRKKRVEKKDKTETDDIEKYLKILSHAKDEEREKLEHLVGMMNTFYQNQYEFFSDMRSQNAEANKYDVWRQGIQEFSGVAKEIVKELGSEKGETETEERHQDTFEDYKKKALPPGSGEKIGNNGAGKIGSKGEVKAGAPILLMAKFIEQNRHPGGYLETLAAAFPKTYAELHKLTMSELFVKLEIFYEILPILNTEQARFWLETMYQIIHPVEQDGTDTPTAGGDHENENQLKETEQT